MSLGATLKKRGAAGKEHLGPQHNDYPDNPLGTRRRGNRGNTCADITELASICSTPLLGASTMHPEMLLPTRNTTGLVRGLCTVRRPLRLLTVLWTRRGSERTRLVGWHSGDSMARRGEGRTPPPRRQFSREPLVRPCRTGGGFLGTVTAPATATLVVPLR